MAKHSFSTVEARAKGNQAKTRVATKGRIITAEEAKTYWEYVTKNMAALTKAVNDALNQNNATAYRRQYDQPGMGKDLVLDATNDSAVNPLEYVTGPDDVFAATAFLVLERGYLQRYDAERSPDLLKYMTHMYQCAFGHILQAYLSAYAVRQDIASGGTGKYAYTAAARRERAKREAAPKEQDMAKRACTTDMSVGPLDAAEAFGASNAYDKHYAWEF